MARQSLPTETRAKLEALGAEDMADDMVRALFGESPEGVLSSAQFGKDVLEQMAALFRAIAKDADNSRQVKVLAKLGQYVADDRAEIMGCELEKMSERAGLAGGEHGDH